ncbi:hypothetical protein TorRG33x02_178690 [Trema orientale]|uniref:Uncharacterized protein n=1 Tax=Trema orientale TaxID=63057 RepID=A0A2P5EL78_TREOI|nr:hypothetical protein TorRG33x02_178690 [Trema orientale]
MFSMEESLVLQIHRPPLQTPFYMNIKMSLVFSLGPFWDSPCSLLYTTARILFSRMLKIPGYLLCKALIFVTSLSEITCLLMGLKMKITETVNGGCQVVKVGAE